MVQAADAAIRLDGIVKRFPGALALSDVSLEVAAGSCHALCGENGAGKSTLGRILAGIHAPDAGTMALHGAPVRFGGPRDALAAGIGMVHQELAFCSNLTVAENLCLGSVPSRRGFVLHEEMAKRAEAMLADIGAGLDVRRLLGGLTIAQQQLVQVASAVGSGARILVFDEPTSSLSQADAERLYQLIGRLKSRGVTCIYVSHRMAEVFRLCDAVTVLRDGQVVATMPMAQLDAGRLTRMMIGRPVEEYLPPAVEIALGEELLRAEHCGSAGAFSDVSLSVRAGEIVGLAGLVGAGRSEFAEAIFGARKLDSGTVTVLGRAVRFRNPEAAIRGGIGLVPEDRKRQGLIPAASVEHNVSLPILGRLSRFFFVRRDQERDLAGAIWERLRLRGATVDAPVERLSGGNQQKVVLARWLAAGSKVLILDEPTRGVDVGAKAEIHALIGALAAQGHAVLLISSELPELLSLSARILVLRSGRLVGEMARRDASQDGLLRLMAGT
ncbi:MAG TPA: sugar ABC transporter ATP-binding protein [Gemmatimonadales bacterium]|jgi:ABC-type sugar transport system ATPase subunit